MRRNDTPGTAPRNTDRHVRRSYEATPPLCARTTGDRRDGVGHPVVMDDDTTTVGRCECGSVRYRVTGSLRDVINCHCSRCRRFTGHHMAATSVPADRLHLLSSETLSWYQPAEGVHYGFCRRCGSSLFWKTDAKSSSVSIAAGTLDQPTGLRTTTAWWVSDAADYHERQAGLTEHLYDGD